MSYHHRQGAATRSPVEALRLLHYPGVALQVQLQNAPAVEQALAQAVSGWVPEPACQTAPGQRVSCVGREALGYASRSSYLDKAITGLGVAGAACAVIADLAQDYFETRPGTYALHCAAFRFNDRLIAATGPRRAGKSTLAARMTQDPDCQVLCDDVLPVTADGEAVGLGIAPRLRLPLPDGASAAFKAHVARYLGPRDDRYGYLCAPNVAPHGTRARLSVLLILDRRSHAAARLHAVSEGDALRAALSQNMSDLHSAERAFAGLSDLLAGVTCLRLVYSDLEDAVALIRAAFGGAAPVAPDIAIGPAQSDMAQPALPASDLGPDICWCRTPDVVLQAKADSAFLWQPGQPMIWHLNLLGHAIWTLLEIPGSARDLALALAEAFPDIGLPRLTEDVNALLAALHADGLVEQADQERAVLPAP